MKFIKSSYFVSNITIIGRMKMKNWKLEEFLREHKNLTSQFEDSRNVESKYQIIKRTINILNPKSFKPSTSNSKIYRESDQYGSETEQGYFRLLNRMCEAQQQSKEQEPKMVNKKKQQSKMRRETNSMHDSRKNYYWNRSKQLENQNKKKKFIEIPNFAEILKKCSVGYMGHSGQLAIQKHYKKVRSALANQIDENKGANIKGENAKLKKEVNRLKQKAKQLYQISFKQFDEGLKDAKNSNSNQDDKSMLGTKYLTQQFKQSHSLHEPLISGNMSTNIKQSSHNQNVCTQLEDTKYGMELNEDENTKVPSFLLRNKARPLSVGTCVIKRPSKLHKKKLAYFRF